MNKVSVGAIKGRVQASPVGAGLPFALRDFVSNRSVLCYLEEGQFDLVSGFWGKVVRLSGYIYREADTGLPVAVRNVLRIEEVPDALPGSYKRARGAVPWEPGDIMPEEAIRRLRDA